MNSASPSLAVVFAVLVRTTGRISTIFRPCHLRTAAFPGFLALSSPSCWNFPGFSGLLKFETASFFRIFRPLEFETTSFSRIFRPLEAEAASFSRIFKPLEVETASFQNFQAFGGRMLRELKQTDQHEVCGPAPRGDEL